MLRVIAGSVLAAAVTSLACALAAQPGAKFDGALAYEHVRQLVSIGPRPAGSAALESARAYIRKTLGASGVDVTEQPFDADTPLGRFKMVNVIATVPGARPDRLVIGGHYDTKLYREFRFVGANDAGSSAAALLELGRVLKSRRNLLTIELVFFDGEEAMLPEWGPGDHTYGSRHYVEAARRQGTIGRVKAMVLLDMIGDKDLRIMREEASTPWLTDIIWSAARRLKLNHIFVEQSTPIEDDHVAFLQAGIPATDVIDLDYPAWHTADDTLDKVSARSMQAVGDVVMEALPQIEERLTARK